MPSSTVDLSPLLLLPEQPNACGNGGFCRRRVDGFQPLPPTGDSRKKKGGGEICACLLTPTPLLAEEMLHPGNLTP